MPLIFLKNTLKLRFNTTNCYIYTFALICTISLFIMKSKQGQFVMYHKKHHYKGGEYFGKRMCIMWRNLQWE